MGDDHCGAVQLRDDAGHCEGFTGAGDAEQGLTGELFLESVDELGDGGGLVPGGRIGGVQLECAGSRRDRAAARLGTELNRNRMGRRGGGFGGHGGIIRDSGVLRYNAPMKSAKKAVAKAAVARKKAAAKKKAGVARKAGERSKVALESPFRNAIAAALDGVKVDLKSAFQEEYTIEARNFGPIAEAKLTLKPLTVLIGPSNTGKTWMATLACMMMRKHMEFSQGHYGEQQGVLPWGGFRKLRGMRGSLSGMEEHESILEKLGKSQLRRFSSQLVDAVESGDGFISVSTLPEELRAKWLTLIREQFYSAGFWADAGSILKEYYGVSDLSKLVADSGRAPAVCKYSAELCGTAMAEATIKLREKRDGNCVVMPKISNFAIPITQSQALESIKVVREIAAGKSPLALRRQRSVLSAAIHAILWSSFANVSVNFLPASRGGLLQAQRVTRIAMTRIASRIGVTGIPAIPTLSRTAVDFLEDVGNMLERVSFFQSIRNPSSADLVLSSETERIAISPKLMKVPPEIHRGNKERQQTVSQIEKLLGGEITAIGSAGDNGTSGLKPPPTIGYRPWSAKSPLAMAQSSSMVGEIAPLVLYLKSGIGYGDTLFIEEPEAHLHPAAQRAMAEILAAMVRAGIRVVITTHSDWMLSTIANIVRRGELGEGSEEAALKKEQVGVWLFDRGRKGAGVTTRELKFGDTGYIPDNLRDLSDDLHNETADLLDAMDEKRSKAAAKKAK